MNQETKQVERFKLYPCVGGYRIRPERPPHESPLLQELLDHDVHALDRLRPGELVLVVGQLMVAAGQRGLLLEPKGRLADPTLHLTRVTPLASTAEMPCPFAPLSGRYACHWGFSDMYPDHQAALAAALNHRGAFDTGEFGVKKEIHYGRVRRAAAGGALRLFVRCEADDGVAQADTAFWKAAGGNDFCDSGEDALKKLGLSDVDIDIELNQLAETSGIGETNEAFEEREFSADAGLSQVLEALDAMAEAADTQLHERSVRMEELAKVRLAELR